MWNPGAISSAASADSSGRKSDEHAERMNRTARARSHPEAATRGGLPSLLAAIFQERENRCSQQCIAEDFYADEWGHGLVNSRLFARVCDT